MSEISEILGDCFEAEPAGYFDFERAEQAIEAYYNKRFEAAIGEDEEESIYHPDAGDLLSEDAITRNQLREEVRKRWQA